MDEDADLAAGPRGLLLGMLLSAGMWTAGIMAAWQLWP